MWVRVPPSAFFIAQMHSLRSRTFLRLALNGYCLRLSSSARPAVLTSHKTILNRFARQSGHRQIKRDTNVSLFIWLMQELNPKRQLYRFCASELRLEHFCVCANSTLAKCGMPLHASELRLEKK